MVINKDLRVTDGAYYNLDLNTIAKNAICSTDEIIVGRWIDGKPIYRKIINYTGTIDTTHSHSTIIGSVPSNISDCIFLYGIMNRGTKSWAPLPYLSWNQHSLTNENIQNYYFGINESYEISFSVQRGSNTNSQTINKVICIVEYTKTTD